MKTTVVNIKFEPYDVYIGRAGKNQDGYFGNPFKIGNNRLESIEKFSLYFHSRLHNDAEFYDRVMSLKGKKLGCFCKPKDCHGDVIADFVDSPFAEFFAHKK